MTMKVVFHLHHPLNVRFYKNMFRNKDRGAAELSRLACAFVSLRKSIVLKTASRIDFTGMTFDADRDEKKATFAASFHFKKRPL